MTWTAQAGLGPRTVALSLKVFIVVMCCAHERLGICTAQQTLPDTLRNYVPEMREHFCSEGITTCGYSGNCGNNLNSLCEQICNPTCTFSCWTTSLDSIPRCNGNQNRFCGYSDAVVCQDDRGTSVNHSGALSTFRICANQGFYTGCEPTMPEEGDISETNVVGIVLWSLFALLLLLVIIAAVMLYLRRQGRLPSFKKRTAKPAELPSVEVGASLSINRLQLPEPSTQDDNVDYSYMPYLPTTKPNLENQAYASVHEEEGSSHDVTNGQEDEETTDDQKYLLWFDPHC